MASLPVSTVILRINGKAYHTRIFEKQPCRYQEIGLDGGYDIGAVHRGLELLGINEDIRRYGDIRIIQ